MKVLLSIYDIEELSFVYAVLTVYQSISGARPILRGGPEPRASYTHGIFPLLSRHMVRLPFFGKEIVKGKIKNSS